MEPRGVEKRQQENSSDQLACHNQEKTRRENGRPKRHLKSCDSSLPFAIAVLLYIPVP